MGGWRRQEIHGCSEGGHGVGWCERIREGCLLIGCGRPLRHQANASFLLGTSGVQGRERTSHTNQTLMSGSVEDEGRLDFHHRQRSVDKINNLTKKRKRQKH